jgi:hypothetical protein
VQLEGRFVETLPQGIPRLDRGSLLPVGLITPPAQAAGPRRPAACGSASGGPTV